MFGIRHSRNQDVDPGQLAYRGAIVSYAQARLMDQVAAQRSASTQAAATAALDVAITVALLRIREDANLRLLTYSLGFRLDWWVPVVAFAASAVCLLVAIALNRPRRGPDSLALAARVEQAPAAERQRMLVAVLERTYLRNERWFRWPRGFLVAGVALLIVGILVCVVLFAGVR